MITDVTGIILTLGNGGEDCPGNGQGTDWQGNAIECCCDECDYLLCCIEDVDCAHCADAYCPRANL